ncbi:WecB/TagA/CpsF family glycosyltransferase [Sulfurovum sp. XTW-4]|uniref:WecB/TagA/CpsF family glycosyltransferase n=1 Tax=Sulfurovum xiamenensis TaxID=3019066 RepID=A0ABT7QTN7_9BACT|nr:WecB/TagA/CpsF family glycosyltransferase [Sulfurovum xiamenensis]MDM5264380.1 WecB/TagA/CpsF family glycosyltransferase [Sulfurovum xiamenensis]
MKKRKVINTLINTGSYEELIGNILDLSKNSRSSYVCISNVHMAIEAYLDKTFCNIVNSSDIATPDGMPLAKAMKMLYSVDQDRVAGMDLMPDLMHISEEKGLSIFLYGSTDEVLKAIVSKAKNEFPNLKLHIYSPPFRTLSHEEKEHIVRIINKHNPDFVFVALGCPKQEKWMSEHKNKINSCMIGLGGALEVYANLKSRAPQWMQNYSLEWLYRLIQDPKRLWKRYLVTNSLFIGLLFVQFIKVRVFKDD